MSVPGYQGDPEFVRLLKSVKSKKELPEVRAIIMRSIWSLDLMHPSQIIAQVMPESQANLKEARIFAGQLLALYNQLAAHQQEDNPFRLFEFPSVKSGDSFFEKINHRQTEILKLLPLFDEANRLKAAAQIKKVQTLAARIEATMDDLDSLLLSLRGNPENTPQLSMANEKMDAIDQNVEAVFNELGMLYKRERHLNMIVERAMADMNKDDPTAAHEKIGRNESCPCGSGKKFKKCCLN